MPGKSVVSVKMGQQVRIKLKLKLGRGSKKAETCDMVFFTGSGKDKAEIDKQTVAIESKEVDFAWTAKGLPEGELHTTVGFEAQIKGKKKGTSSDFGTFQVWAKEIKLKINDEGGQPLTDALFRVSYADIAKVMKYSPDEGGDSMSIELARCEKPGIEMVPPFDLLEWVKPDGVEWEIKAKKLPAKAVFLRPMVGPATEPPDIKSKQYVNLPAGDDVYHGNEFTVAIGADQPLSAPTSVYIHVLFSAAPGLERSERDDPISRLKDANWENPAGTEFKGDALLTHHIKKPATFKIELGLAGGDVCTIKIGSTPECRDGTIELTNWRKLQYDLRYPGPGLSDLGKLGKTTADFSPDVFQKMSKILEKAFIEYSKSSEEAFEANAWPELLPEYACYQGDFIGKSKGKKLFVMEETSLKELGEKLTEAIDPPQKPYCHTIIVADYINETQSAKANTVFTMSKPSKTVTLHKDKFQVFPLENRFHGERAPGIREIVYKLTKLDGKAVTSENDITSKGLSKYFFAGVRPYELSEDRGQQLNKMAAAVEFLSTNKIKLTMTECFQGTKPADVLQQYPKSEFTVSIEYYRREKESCAGMNWGNGGLMMFPIVHASNSVQTCIVHELCHAIDLAYGTQGASGFTGTGNDSKVIPGLPFRKGVADGGNAYNAHGHAGGHCAKGLSASLKREPDYSAAFTLTGARLNFAPKCLNWGQDLMRFGDLGLCEECTDTMRAQDLRDFSKFD